MRLIGSLNFVSLALHGLAVVAVAGIVHIVTILQAPARAPQDAFARLAVVTPLNALARLDPARSGGGTIPFQDPSMATAACRFDLSDGPVRLTVEHLDRGFISIGMHGRHGIAFYGLNVHASERSPLTIVLLTAEQKSAAEAADAGDQPIRDLRVVAPDRQGFVLAHTPLGDDHTEASAQRSLDRIRCQSDHDLPAAAR